MNDLIQYNEVKDKMKTGDLLQWASSSVIGWLIRWKTKSDVNHSSLVIRLAEYEGLERRRFTHEALEHGVILNLLSRRLDQFNGKVWWYPLKDEWDKRRQRVGELALAWTGVPYDYQSIVDQLISSVSAEATALFCSEMCFMAYGFAGKAPTPGEMLRLNIFKEGVQIL